MQQGGWDMWLLLLLSVAGLAVVIERLIFFASQHGDTKGLLRSIGQRIAADDIDGAVKVCPAKKACCRAFSSSVCSAVRRIAPILRTRFRSRSWSI